MSLRLFSTWSEMGISRFRVSGSWGPASGFGIVPPGCLVNLTRLLTSSSVKGQNSSREVRPCWSMMKLDTGLENPRHPRAVHRALRAISYQLKQDSNVKWCVVRQVEVTVVNWCSSEPHKRVVQTMTKMWRWGTCMSRQNLKVVTLSLAWRCEFRVLD